MASAITDPRPAPPGAPVAAPPDPEAPPAPAGLLDDLDHPDLVISLGYVGPERRRNGPLARLRRATHAPRRWLLTLESAVLVVMASVVAAVVLVPTPSDVPAAGPTAAHRATSSAPPDARAPTSTVAPASPAPAASVPAPAPAPPVTAPAPAAAPPAPTPPAAPAPASAAAASPDQLGAEALALVRYPWQQIPGYTIQFLPGTDAPSAGFYGNTTFVWGRVGGTSVLYVYPGETVGQLAGIVAFEIGHEVDAAAVEPSGGEAQIENILNYHPSSWAPNCDCAEQDYLSGWYAAAFSNFWSPGVGNWSRLPVAPPSGATLGEVAQWLNPAIP